MSSYGLAMSCRYASTSRTSGCSRIDKLTNDKGHFALRELFDQLVAMRVLAIQHRKVPPTPARFVQPLQFVSHPRGLFLRRLQFHDANLLAVLFVGLQHLLRKFRAHLIHGDDLSGHPQNIWRRAIIFRQRHAIGRRILPLFPSGKALQKQFEAAKRGAAEAVDGLIVVADHHDVARFRAQQMKQAQVARCWCPEIRRPGYVCSAPAECRRRLLSLFNSVTASRSDPFRR